MGPANFDLDASKKKKREHSKELFDATKIYGNYLSDSIENSSLEGSYREHFKARAAPLPPRTARQTVRDRVARRPSE